MFYRTDINTIPALNPVRTVKKIAGLWNLNDLLFMLRLKRKFLPKQGVKLIRRGFSKGE